MSGLDRQDLPCAPLGPSGSGSAAAEGEQGHAHGVDSTADSRYLGVALGLISAFMLAEVVAAVVSGSLALLADAGHMLTDVAALARQHVGGPISRAGPRAGRGPTGSSVRRYSRPPSTGSAWP